MRTFFRLIATAVLILFILHGILGATSMTGLSNIDIYPLTVAFLVLLGAHILCSLHYVAQSLTQTKRHYFRLNRNLWIRRFSGLAVLILALCHAYLFRFLPNLDLDTKTFIFTAINILLLSATYIHIRYNVDAYIISRGAEHYRKRAVDLLVFLTVFFIYFLLAKFYFYMNK